MNKEKYIIFYSEQCNYCKEFLTALYKNVDLYRQFAKINVDKISKIPPNINLVPTIIVTVDNKRKKLESDDAFNWLYSMSNQVMGFNNDNSSNISEGISSYDPSAMSGFSDSFASWTQEGINPNATVKNFSFLQSGGGDNLIKPPDEGPPSENKLKNDDFSRTLEDYKAQRDMEVNPGITRKG